MWSRAQSPPITAHLHHVHDGAPPVLTGPAAAARRGVGGGLGAGRARVRVVEVVTAHGEDLIISVQLDAVHSVPECDFEVLKT